VKCGFYGDADYIINHSSSPLLILCETFGDSNFHSCDAVCNYLCYSVIRKVYLCPTFFLVLNNSLRSGKTPGYTVILGGALTQNSRGSRIAISNMSYFAYVMTVAKHVDLK
jgi:hypothetical protein